MNAINTLGFDPKQFMDDLVSRGLAQRSGPTAWNDKHVPKKTVVRRPLHTTRATLPAVGTKDEQGYECIGCQRIIVDGEERWKERWLSPEGLARMKMRSLT